MPLDALCLSGLVRELDQTVTGGKIDKIYQPSRDEVILALRTPAQGNVRLLLSANPSHPRPQLTQLTRENPDTPPMFCMLLRKHLSGARILSVAQPPLERVVTLTLEALNELGDRVERRLVLEAIGRRSNLILLDEEGRILDCIRRVESSLGTGSAQRALLPGMFYRLPPPQAKLDPMAQDRAALEALLSAAPEEAQADQWLLDTFGGLSPLICRELAFQAGGAVDIRLNILGPEGRKRLLDRLERLLDAVRTGRFSPCLLARDGAPSDFTFFPVEQYEGRMERTPFPTFSALLDRFYEEREHLERVKQRGQDLIRSVTTARDRTARKIAHQEQELAATHDRERLRQLGDILTSNFYQMERGMARLRTVDFYDPEGREIDVPLDPLLTPQQNAAKYYKEYNKAKTAEVMLTQQLEMPPGTGLSEQRAGHHSPGRGREGPSGDPAGAHRHRLSPPSLQGQGPGEAGGLQTNGVPLLRRTAHLRGQEQHPKRPAHLQAGLQERYMVPHPEDPRLPRHSLDGGAGPRPPEPERGRLPGRLVLPGQGSQPGPSGLHPGQICEKAQRGPPRHGDLHHL